MTHLTEQELDVDGLIYVESVLCAFEVSTERYEEEPYSYGERRGFNNDTAATLTVMALGGDQLDRSQACRIFGKEAIERLEKVIENE